MSHVFNLVEFSHLRDQEDASAVSAYKPSKCDQIIDPVEVRPVCIMDARRQENVAVTPKALNTRARPTIKTGCSPIRPPQHPPLTKVVFPQCVLDLNH